ncbi:MAG TPA: hypothetical protein VIG93_01485, partial [Gaiellaceae bacterium]
GTSVIVTDRAVLDVTDAGLVLRSIHPGEDLDSVLAATPVRLDPSGARETAAPTEDELRLIREELDPHRWYTA